MAIAWSRISSKVIAHPPEPHEACTRRCGNWRSCSGVCIPHMVDRRKQEVLGVRDAALPEARGYGARTLGQTSPGNAPHGAQEPTMSPRTRDAKQHAKARQCCRLKAPERLARDRAKDTSFGVGPNGIKTLAEKTWKF